MTASEPAPTPQPRGLPFRLQANETVLLLCRRHWWHLWPKSIIWLLFALVPVAVAAWLLSLADVLDDLGIFFWAVAAVWLVYWGVRLFLNWYRYHNDIWLVTNQRLIDSFKPHPFDLKISTADLVNVQDMTVERSGVLRTLLDYGDIVCQTAAENQDFRLPGIPDPRDVQVLIDRERDRERLRIR